jgi:RNA polymerase sigma factor (sigma-70 family)
MSALPSATESPGAVRAGQLYERHAGQVLRFCRARLSPQEAEDALQHTFLNAYRSLRAGTVPRVETAWLFAIAENVCRERRRSAWRRSRIEVVSDDGVVDEAAPERPLGQLDGLADALAELTPNQRRAILLREWQGLSYREIAAELELTESAVETLLFRARRSLARKLDRVRGRAWSWSDLGSALASGKSLLGGAAVKVAAATLVAATGVTAATPALRTGRPPARAASAVAPPPARHDRATTVPAVPRRQAPNKPVRFAAKPRHRPAGVPARRARPQANPPALETTTPPAPAPQPVHAPPLPPPPAVVVAPPPPPVQVPALPPVELPRLPELPPPPALPSGGGVPLPELPPLPPLP